MPAEPRHAPRRRPPARPSFAVIGAHWMSHHAVFRWIRRLGGRVLRYNLLWLMIIVMLPYLTKLLTEGEDDGTLVVRFGLYALALRLLDGPPRRWLGTDRPSSPTPEINVM